jgi:7-carboxy-7-deazaguanine synthase
MYTVKEIFYTLQGEGANTGRAAVFCRFTGCNLWTGREADRASAVCRFCDTDFVGVSEDGGRYPDPGALADAIASLWPAGGDGDRFVVCTGGEPLLQLDEPLIGALHARGFAAGAALKLETGDELKLVFPQPGAEPERFVDLAFTHWFLQPMDGPDRERNTRAAVAYCLAHPRWRLSLQTHKTLGLR